MHSFESGHIPAPIFVLPSHTQISCLFPAITIGTFSTKVATGRPAMKKRISIAFFATVVMTGGALAADLPVYAPRPPFIPQQAVEWTGFYFGANAGYGWGQQASNIVFSGSSASGLTNPLTGVSFFGSPVLLGPGPTELSGTRVNGSAGVSGGIAGGQIGFNWQAGMFVFGGEIDGQWSGQESTFTVGCGAGCTATQNVQLRSLVTGRGRFGLAFDWIMPYVTGGAALVNGLDNLTMTVGGVTANFMPLSGSTLGWTAGAGVEVALWSNWSAKFEYLYVSANGPTVIAPIPNALGVGIATTPMEFRDNIVRVGFNYRFGPRGGPGVLERPYLPRDTYAWSSDLAQSVQVATARVMNLNAQARPAASQDVARQAAPIARENAPVMREASAVTSDAAPVAREAPPVAKGTPAVARQTASASSEPQSWMAEQELDDAEAIATLSKPVRQVAKKRPEKEEDESARMKRIMSICSGC
jgi:outer membrane immunogenic protein